MHAAVESARERGCLFDPLSVRTDPGAQVEQGGAEPTGARCNGAAPSKRSGVQDEGSHAT